jgi:hypothetical protein
MYQQIEVVHALVRNMHVGVMCMPEVFSWHGSFEKLSPGGTQQILCTLRNVNKLGLVVRPERGGLP